MNQGNPSIPLNKFFEYIFVVSIYNHAAGLACFALILKYGLKYADHLTARRTMLRNDRYYAIVTLDYHAYWIEKRGNSKYAF